MALVGEPVARSTLGATPLLHVLVSLLAREASGTLVIESTAGGRSAVVLEGGIPTKMCASEPVGRLSDVLISLGCLDSITAKETYDTARNNQGLHGRVLVDQHLLDEETLTKTLRAQLALKLGWAASLAPETALDLYENVDLLTSWPAGPSFDSPLEAIWALARNYVDLRSVASVLRQLVNRPLRLHPLSQPEWFGFNDIESSVIERLSAGSPDMQTLIQQSSVPVRVVQVLLYVLTITRHLDLGQRKPPIGFSVSGSGEHRRARKPRSAPSLHLEQGPNYTAIRAINAMQRAEQLLEQHKLIEAEAEAKLAIEHDPSLLDCQALYAWIQACRPGNAADLPRCLEIMTNALEYNPIHETLRFRRAQLLSRLGQVDEALREYRLIVELNPRHTNAMREIRLWEMRNPRKSGRSGEFSRTLGMRASDRPPAPGLFGRLFKK